MVAKKLAATVEELESYLVLEPSLQPEGFTPQQLATWDTLPESVRRAFPSRGPTGG